MSEKKMELLKKTEKTGVQISGNNSGVLKPYEAIRNYVERSTLNSAGNRDGLLEFLDNEHPGDVLFTKWEDPPIIERGKGSTIWDVDGNKYIDCIAGMSSMNIGHGDARVAKVLSDQYQKLSHWFDFPTPERLRLVRRLMEITPGNYRKRVRLALSGSDAVENAIRAARNYTGRTHIISFYGAYHGQNVATMGLTGAGSMHKWYNPVPAADHCIERFPYAYCYRCPYDKEYPSCAMYCVKAIENLLSSGQTSLGSPAAKINNIAAMIVEPAQSSSGYIVPPKEFLVELRRLADKFGFLLIFDEIQSGMGRTGTMFAAERSGVAPDITLIGKALGAGHPISAVVARAEIFEDLAPGHVVSTYAGSALGCAVANKVLDVFEEDKLLDHVVKVGEHLETLVAKLKEDHPLVGSYTRAGIFLGIELVLDRATKEPAPREAKEFVNRLRQEGVLVQLNGYYLNRISILPPLVITPEEFDIVFETANRVLTSMEKRS